MEFKRTLDAIKIARVVLEERRNELEIMALGKGGAAAVAMAALLFLESLAAHSIVGIDLDPVREECVYD